MNVAGPSQGVNCSRPSGRNEVWAAMERRPERRFALASIPAREHARDPSPRGERCFPEGGRFSGKGAPLMGRR